ncbi:hypothetical protein AN389_03909 [Pseudoalteromonas sp. P1-7a]|nr:hypothetical protein AN389_03909 [Pseudoalteromonas sp. P1-7a]
MLVVIAAVLSSSTESCAEIGLPATSDTLAMAVSVPSFSALASIGSVTYSPFCTSAVVSTWFVPSLIKTVTVWPSSTSVTVPRTTMAALSPLPLITPSAVLSMLVVIAAVLSSSTLSCALTGLPAKSDALAVAVSVPSLSALASIGSVTYSPFCTSAVVSTWFVPSLMITVTV